MLDAITYGRQSRGDAGRHAALVIMDVTAADGKKVRLRDYGAATEDGSATHLGYRAERQPCAVFRNEPAAMHPLSSWAARARRLLPPNLDQNPNSAEARIRARWAIIAAPGHGFFTPNME